MCYRLKIIHYYHDDSMDVCLPGQHAREKLISSALFCRELIGSLLHYLFQMIGIFLEFANHVVQDVGMTGELIKQPIVNRSAMHL